MKSFQFEQLDGGALTVSAEFVPLLQSSGLDSFHALMNSSDGTVAKNLLAERTTTRFELTDDTGTARVFYIKRHRRPPWKEYVKPWLRLTRPILGAENEWRAILAFHECGIPTMRPVALGRRNGESFLVTEGLEGCIKLSDWMERYLGQGENDSSSPRADSRDSEAAAPVNAVVDRLAAIARQMHSSGLHHQDFYLTHFLLPAEQVDAPQKVHVIDLGRARQCRPLSARWVVKDLAQLNYSASRFSPADRRRFLEQYLGREIGPGDQRMMRKIERKTAAIARHSRRHQL